MAIPSNVREKVFARDHFRCSVCGRFLNRSTAQVSHIKPLAEGGTDDEANLQTICPLCHYKFDRFFQFVPSPSRELTRGWITAFLRAPVTTVSISLVLTILAAIAGFKVFASEKKQQEMQRAANRDYVVQIAKLNETEQRLKELLSFVGDQREALKQNEDAISRLKSQKESLAPLVASDQRIVDALFAAQEQRNQKAVSRERWVGFALGVVSSIVASTLIGIVAFFIKKPSVKDANSPSEHLPKNQPPTPEK